MSKTKTMILPHKVSMFVPDETTGGHVIKSYGPGIVEAMPAEHADHPHMMNSGAREYDHKAEAEKAKKAAEEAQRRADIAEAEAELTAAEAKNDENAIKQAKAKLKKLGVEK